MIKKNSVIYQIVTDRFNNDNNNLCSEIEKPDYNERFREFLGGTFKGIANKANFLADLGITNLLISPIVDSKDYHGYNPENQREINKNFGSEDDLREMIKILNEKGIGLIIDYIFTHISSKSKIFQEGKKGWFMYTDADNKNPRENEYLQQVTYKLNNGILPNPNQYKKLPYLGYFWLETHPLFNLENLEVRNFHKENLEYWLNKFKFEGIRSDSTFLQPRSFSREIYEFLKQNFPELSFLAEHWDFQENEGISVFRCYDFADGEFDIRGTLLLNSLPNDEGTFQKMLGHYYRNRDVFMQRSTILSIDNHDLPRFPGDKNLQKIAATLQFTFPTIPLIYYGNEIGMKQYNDGRDRIAQSRDPMRFDIVEENKDMLQFYKNLIRFRKEARFNRYNITEVQINDNNALFTYKIHVDENKAYYIMLNREKNKKPIDITAMFSNPEINPHEITRDKILELESNKILHMEEESAYLFADKDNKD